MKKTLSLFLCVCALLSLIVLPASAETTYTEKKIEELRAGADRGDLKALGELGLLYYRGSYSNGISRDFSRALELLLKAADGGDPEVLLTVGKLYEAGSAGTKSLISAYDWYKKAAEAGSAEARTRLEDSQFDKLRYRDNLNVLTGRLGEPEDICGYSAYPFYLNKPLVNCSQLGMDFTILSYTGYPFGLYALFGKDLEGKWRELARFEVEKSQEGTGPRSYEFELDQPASLQALAVTVVEDGMWFTLEHEAVYTAGKDMISEYRGAAPVFKSAAAANPVISASVNTSAYYNPFA